MSEKSGKVQTVLGLIDPSELGHTQPHEHLICDLVPPYMTQLPGEKLRLDNLGHYRLNWSSNTYVIRLDSEEEALEEMRRYKTAGGGTLVELTLPANGRDAAALARISTKSQVHIVMGCGFYTADYHPPENDGKTVEELAEFIVSEVTDGCDGTDSKAGIIGEIGLDYPVKPQEDKVLRAAIQASVKTGAPLTIHPGRNPSAPLEAIKIVREAGGNVERTIMDHIERTLFDFEAMLELAKTGCYVEFDLFGQENCYYPLAEIDMPNDATRINFIIKLIEAGFLDRILISQDICMKIHRTDYGGFGYTHIINNVIPRMKRKGMSDAEIKAITVDNPARILAFP